MSVLDEQKDMNEIAGINNIFPSWKVKKLIGSGSYGKVYELERVEDDAVYRSAMKIITIPQNDSEINSRLAEGESRESVKAYYDDVTRSLLNENRIMAGLKGNSNIVSYEDHQLVRHEDGIGSDIFIRMELLTSFIDYMADNRIDEDTVIRLGIDMCKALEICEKKNLIHRDIKPGNIFVSDTGDFKLGDFGIARTIDRTMGGLSKKGTYRFMAPEVYKGEPYGRTVDICSLGLVMYYLMNGKRTPFLPAAPASVSFTDEENALIQRMNGEQIPPPRQAERGLAAIILKACSFNPAERYQSAAQMREDLEALKSGGFRPKAAGQNTPAAAAASAGARQPRRPRESTNEKKTGKPIIIAAAAGVVLIGLLIFALGNTLASRNAVEPEMNAETATEQADTTQAAKAPSVKPQNHVYAHRSGYRDELDWNVFEQYDRFIEQGAEYIEQDVHEYNGEVVISYSYPQNSSKTRLRDVFDRYGRNVYYLVEIKRPYDSSAYALTNLVREYGYEDQVVVQCFEKEWLKEVKDVIPNIRTMFLIDRDHDDGDDLLNALQDRYIDEISVKYGEGYMTEGNCKKVQNARKRFSAWTLQDDDSVIEAIELGLDGYFTTHPGRAIELEGSYRDEE